ncbi:hypothetical protein ES705_24644 [subsurface metagenome]
MQSLRDKARELVSIAEGEILRKEATITALRRENEKAKGELAAVNAQQRAVRSEKCKGCIFKLAALRRLDEEGASKKANSVREEV